MNATSAPLCQCCEKEPADIKADGWPLTDKDTGEPVCISCFEWLYAAKQFLARAGFRACEALGPGQAKGGLGA